MYEQYSHFMFQLTYLCRGNLYQAVFMYYTPPQFLSYRPGLEWEGLIEH